MNDFLHLFRDVEYLPFGIAPAEAGVGNGFSVHLVFRLVALFQKAFYHKALDDFFEIGIVKAVLHNLFADTYLLFEFFAAVGMVCVYNHCGVFESRLGVPLNNLHYVFVMEVGNIVAVAVHCAAKYCVRKLIAVGFDLPAVQLEGLSALRRIYRIEHYEY